MAYEYFMLKYYVFIFFGYDYFETNPRLFSIYLFAIKFLKKLKFQNLHFIYLRFKKKDDSF